jgi:hypothetical protein
MSHSWSRPMIELTQGTDRLEAKGKTDASKRHLTRQPVMLRQSQSPIGSETNADAFMGLFVSLDLRLTQTDATNADCRPLGWSPVRINRILPALQKAPNPQSEGIPRPMPMAVGLSAPVAWQSHGNTAFRGPDRASPASPSRSGRYGGWVLGGVAPTRQRGKKQCLS